MRLDVLVPSRLRPGMLVAGIVRLDAPTRPVQPIAAAMTIEDIEPADSDGLKGFYIVWKAGRSQWYRLYDPHLSFLIITP
jgi:hypothetical protein